jgi:predicted DsbA family dithiol-disulfide isomerase
MPLNLTLFSDFVCPWCYLAERSTVQRLQDEYDVDVEWIGFELHPEIPRGGLPIEALLPRPVLEQMHRPLQAAAARLGLPLRVPEWVPNTRTALGVAEFGRAHGGLDAFRHRAMDAFWADGRDLEDRDVLGELASEAGMDADAALAFALSRDGEAAVHARREIASERGVTAIPTVLLGRLPILGYQPWDVFARAAERAGAVPRPAAAANCAPEGFCGGTALEA